MRVAMEKFSSDWRYFVINEHAGGYINANGAEHRAPDRAMKWSRSEDPIHAANNVKSTTNVLRKFLCHLYLALVLGASFPKIPNSNILKIGNSMRGYETNSAKQYREVTVV